MTLPFRPLLALIALLSVWSLPVSASSVVEFTDREFAFIKSHGPWPPSKVADSGNRFSANPTAIAIGKRLFSDSRLARTQGMACAFCHRPERYFADGLARGVGTKILDRNTPSLFNVAFNRWFGWDGAADSLWAQSIRPIIAEEEMNADPSVLRQLFRDDSYYRQGITELVGEPIDQLSDDNILAMTGKLLAAFQETLITPRTSFDAFRDALLEGDTADAARYPVEAQRGLKLFTGRGQCSLCHFGPGFTNGEFANVGVVHMLPDGEVDRGRLQGIEEAGRSKFNLTGRFNDNASGSNAVGTRQLRFRHSSFGEFRVPGLRGVAQTSPYMHNGSFATLEDVVRHYSEINLDRLHVHGENILVPLHLDDGEVRDLVAFLESLAH